MLFFPPIGKSQSTALPLKGLIVGSLSRSHAQSWVLVRVPRLSAQEAWGRLRCHSLCSSCSWQWTRSSRAAKKKLGQYLVYRGLLDVASVLECHILWSKSFKPLEAQLPPVFPSFGPEIEIKKKKKSQECQTRPFAHKNLNGELSPEGSFRSCGALGVK